MPSIVLGEAGIQLAGSDDILVSNVVIIAKQPKQSSQIFYKLKN